MTTRRPQESCVFLFAAARDLPILTRVRYEDRAASFSERRSSMLCYSFRAASLCPIPTAQQSAALLLPFVMSLASFFALRPPMSALLLRHFVHGSKREREACRALFVSTFPSLRLVRGAVSARCFICVEVVDVKLVVLL